MFVYAVGYTMDVMYFSWLSNAVEIDKDIELPQFKLRQTILFECSQNYTGGTHIRHTHTHHTHIHHTTHQHTHEAHAQMHAYSVQSTLSSSIREEVIAKE